MKYDVIIVGAGPAGLFTAIEMFRCGSEKKILIIEKEQPAEKRYCHITTGFSDKGTFSDGMLSLSCEGGGTLPELIGEKKAQELIDYTDKIYLEFSADECVEGVFDPDRIYEITQNAVDRPIRYLETGMAQQLYARIEKYLLDSGVEILFGTVCDDIIVENGRCTGVICSGSPIYGPDIVIAAGRKGADWLERICVSHGCSYKILKKDNTGRVEMDKHLKTNIKGLYCLGDSSGWTCGFMMASVMGVLMGKELYYYEFAQRVHMGDRAY